MIEIKLTGEAGYIPQMQAFASFYNWLISMLTKAQPSPILLQGCVSIFDFETSKLNILLLCYDDLEKQIMSVLKEPPEVLQNTFIAEIVNESTNETVKKTTEEILSPVEEKSTSSSDDVAMQEVED